MDFLQSEFWRNFQKAVGRRVFFISRGSFYASLIEHQLPLVGKYFYIPRGPVVSIDTNFQFPISNFQSFLSDIINLAKKEKAGWIRIEPADEKILEIISNNIEPFLSQGSTLKIQKAPRDMQPREIFVIDITKSEEELLAGMKSKTRYNIKVAQKHSVQVRAISNTFCHPERGVAKSKNIINLDSSTTLGMTYIDELIRLVKITAKRDKITPHPESYYRKMFEVIPADILKLYVAEYENKVIAANIMAHWGDTAIYLHGASDNKHRNVMAPYLLQWQAIKDAKAAGLAKYDLGGIKVPKPKSEAPNPKQIPNSKFQIQNSIGDSWQGITRFKTGFSPDTKPTVFPGSYDVIINSKMYFLYRLLQQVKNFFV